MVERSYVNGPGPAQGEDDKTRFIYQSNDVKSLKQQIDNFSIKIYRDGKVDESLVALVQNAGKAAVKKDFKAEMVPLRGAIAYVGAKCVTIANQQCEIYARPDCLRIGLTDGFNLNLLDVWFSSEDYMRANPSQKLSLDYTIKEIALPGNKKIDLFYSQDSNQMLQRLVKEEMGVKIHKEDSKKRLAMLVRKSMPLQGTWFAAEMIPLREPISYAQISCLIGLKKCQLQSSANQFNVVFNEQGFFEVLSVWYSEEAYLMDNPNLRTKLEKLKIKKLKIKRKI
ncbi:MAG: hypothetical protein ABH824_01255 [Nanoarchaeota archaeon]